MEDWGEIKLNQLDNSDDFWSLFDELSDDKSMFLHNKSIILDAYKNGNLYGLIVTETDKMYEKEESQNDIFCRGLGSMYLLPCFCVKETNKAIIIWTHTRARKNGFAKCLIDLLDIKYAYNPLPDSIDFWKKCNVTSIF